MQHDVAIIGGGHNGLVAAAYLARAGRDVVVLERRPQVGGSCITEELIPGFRFSTCAYIVSSLRPQILRDLELEKHGLDLYAPDVMNFVMGKDHRYFFLWPELDRTVSELERHAGKADAAGFVEFGVRFKRFAHLLEHYLLEEPPSLSEVVAAFERENTVDLFHEFVSQSIGDTVDRYFVDDLIKGYFLLFGLVAVHAGPYSPGTAYVFGHHAWGEFNGEFGRAAFARGGMGAIADALTRSAEAAGAVIRTDAGVSGIDIERGRVRAVRLASGEVISARTVISNADPKHTLLSLVPSSEMSRHFRGAVERIDMRGSMGRVHFVLDELPAYAGLPTGSGPQHRCLAILGATPDEFQRCWEIQLRRELSKSYPVELIAISAADESLGQPGSYTLSTGTQQLPFALERGGWDRRREEFVEAVVRSVTHFAPNFESSIKDYVAITPLDLEREYGLTNGNIFQGAMSLNQLFASRGAPGIGGYRTPIRGLYLCGSGTHPGGAVMGAAGHNAAMAVLADQSGGGAGRQRAARHVGQAGGLLERQSLAGVRYWGSRQRWLRPIARWMKRAPR